jgi:hypothetical protein
MSNDQLFDTFFGKTNKVAAIVFPVIVYFSGGNRNQVIAAAPAGMLITGIVKLMLEPKGAPAVRKIN